MTDLTKPLTFKDIEDAYLAISGTRVASRVECGTMRAFAYLRDLSGPPDPHMDAIYGIPVVVIDSGIDEVVVLDQRREPMLRVSVP